MLFVGGGCGVDGVADGLAELAGGEHADMGCAEGPADAVEVAVVSADHVIHDGVGCGGAAAERREQVERLLMDGGDGFLFHIEGGLRVDN